MIKVLTRGLSVKDSDARLTRANLSLNDLDQPLTTNRITDTLSRITGALSFILKDASVIVSRCGCYWGSSECRSRILFPVSLRKNPQGCPRVRNVLEPSLLIGAVRGQRHTGE